MTKAHTFVDDFDDNMVGGGWNTLYGTPAPVEERIREINGRIEIRLASGTTGSAGMYPWGYYDMTDSSMMVELVRAPSSQAIGAFAFLRVRVDLDQDHVEIRVSGGTVACSTRISGQYTYFGAQQYDAVRHRWLRIREKDGTTYMEVSPDAIVWTLLSSLANPFFMSYVDFELGAGTTAAAASPGIVVFDNLNVRPRRACDRRVAALGVRVDAAQLAAARPHEAQVDNGDEESYDRSFVGNYSKSLAHDALGDPDPESYRSLLRALESGESQDFELIQLASATAKKLTNPQAGLTFDIEGPDPQEVAQPPAPRFDSEQTAHEAGELYWMAVARDIAFTDYGTNAVIGAAVTSLSGEFPQFGGTVPATRQNVFRGIYPGEQVGPYVSQFLLKGNVDPRKPDGLGRDANEGFISYGSRVIDQRLIPAAAGVDYLTTFSAWLNAQNGVDTRGQDQFDTTRRFIRNLRDGATFVHFDQVLDAFYNAAWILMSEPTGNQLTLQPGVTGRPQIDLEFPKDQGNPYDPPGTAMDSPTQVGFATFGPTHLLQVLGEVLGRALRAVWWQKWGVHRRLRPEEFGGRVDNWIAGRRDYPIHPSIKNSLLSGALAPYFGQAGEKFPTSYLLPQAYPEGAPTHPAYGAGHATGSGACVTILKAFFDETKAIENPVTASSDGLSLLAYSGADAGQMTVGGELNKLAGNIAIFRNAAGVHWRSDYTESLPFGEAIAIRLLQEMSLGFNEEDAFFQLTKFDGTTIRIFDGKVVPMVA